MAHSFNDTIHFSCMDVSANPLKCVSGEYFRGLSGLITLIIDDIQLSHLDWKKCIDKSGDQMKDILSIVSFILALPRDCIASTAVLCKLELRLMKF